MYKTIKNITGLFLAFILVMILQSCREGIIEPGRPVGNINEPVILKTGQAYSFQIDADNISFNKNDRTFLDITNTDVSLSVTNYTSGSVFLKIIGDNKEILYQVMINKNFNGIQESIKNHVADLINLTFQNFSGRMKIQLTKTPREF